MPGLPARLSAMSSYLASFIGGVLGKPVAASSNGDADEDGGHHMPEGHPKRDMHGSCPWIGLETTGKQMKVTCNPEAADVLRTVGDNTPLNVVSIFGAARQGKSFLMNLLAGDAQFKISNSKDPCTQGVDLSRKILTWSAFHQLDKPGDHPSRSIKRASSEPLPRVALVDCEGQGDRDVAYDANLVCPILLTSKVVIFNWKDSLQRDRLLNLLGVMQRAAYNVSPDEEGAERVKQHKIFGHLHVVFRDWAFEGDVHTVRQTLFTTERSASPDAASRNELRRVLEASFESISVWLLPPPVERTAALSKALSPDDLSDHFKSEVAKLRHAVAEQLKEPHHFNGKILTGTKIATLVPTLTDILNSGEAILPRSAYASLLEVEVSRVQANTLVKLQKALETVKHEAEKQPMSTVRLKGQLLGEIQKLQREYDRWLGTLGDDELRATAAATFDEHCTKAIDELIHFNKTHFLSGHLTRSIRQAKDHFDEHFTRPIQTRLPCAADQLAVEGHRATEAAVAIVKRVVAGEQGLDEVLKEAVEAVSNHAELHITRVQSMNKEKLEEAHKQELDAYGAAKQAFIEQFLGRLTALQAQGPIAEADFIGAFNECLATAHATLEGTLRSRGMASKTRVAELVKMLTDAAGHVKAEQGACYELACSKQLLTATLHAFTSLLSVPDQLVLPVDRASELEAKYVTYRSSIGRSLEDALTTVASAAPAESKAAVLNAWKSLGDRQFAAVREMNKLSLLKVRLEQESQEQRRVTEELQADRAVHSKDTARLQAEAQRLADHHTALQRSNEQLQIEMKTLKDKAKDLEGKARALEATLTQKQTEVDALRAQVDEEREAKEAAQAAAVSAQAAAAAAIEDTPSFESPKLRSPGGKRGGVASRGRGGGAGGRAKRGHDDDDDDDVKPPARRKRTGGKGDADVMDTEEQQDNGEDVNSPLEVARREARRKIEEDTQKRIAKKKNQS